MTGQELYIKHTSKRDYSNSSDDEYAQLLMTIYTQIREEIYPLLEQAEKENKKIDLLYPDDTITDEGTIILV